METHLTPNDGDALGFELDDALWLARLRNHRDPPTFGKLGAYELVSVLGRGGQGLVYRARQPRTGREVALKRLSAGAFATPEMRARFDREIEAAAALDHPNIVTVFGTELVEGQQLLAMKWIDGVAIDRWACPAGCGPRPIREVLEAFVLVCDAVHHAHQRGVIHRDLKPSNILVDARNRPHVLDFGLAKVQRESVAADSITMTGDFLGTPAYAAPEQLRGDVRAVDVRTDVYGLGTILFQLLTGQLAFPSRPNLPELMKDVLNRDAPQPSSLNPHLNRELDAIILKALSKEKSGRYQSVEAFAADVRRYLTGQTVLAHPPSTTYQVRKFVRQHRGAVAALGSIVFLLGATTVISTILMQRANRERDRADAALLEKSREADRARRESTKASTTAQFVTQILARANRSEENGNPNVTVREAMDAAATELEDSPGKYEPDIEGALRFTIADTYDALGLPALAEPHFVKARELLRDGTDQLRYADCLHKLGIFFRRQHRMEEARECLEDALDIRQRLLPDPNNPLFPETYSSLAILARQQGDFAAAESLFLKAIEGFQTALGPDDPNIGTQTKNLGVLNMYWERWETAEHYLREAMAFFERIPGDHESDLCMARENLAIVLNRDGDATGEGEQILRDAIERSVRINGADHPSTANTIHTLANLRAKKGDLEEAFSLAETALRYIEAARLKSAIAFYTTCAEKLDRAEEAEVVLRQCMAARTEQLGDSHPVIGYFQFTLTRLCIRSKRFQEAEELIQPAWAKLAHSAIIGTEEKAKVIETAIKLYEQWDAAESSEDKADKVAHWQDQLQALAISHDAP